MAAQSQAQYYQPPPPPTQQQQQQQQQQPPQPQQQQQQASSQQQQQQQPQQQQLPPPPPLPASQQQGTPQQQQQLHHPTPPPGPPSQQQNLHHIQHQSSHQLQMVTSAPGHNTQMGQLPQVPHHHMPNPPPNHHFQTPSRSSSLAPGAGMMDSPGINHPANTATAGHIRGSKHGTPLGTPDSARKRQRKADHAFPGEDGDLELKNMAAKVLDIPLDEFAAKVRAIEASTDSPTIHTPTSSSGRLVVKNDSTKERQRQVFGMTWLMRACQASNSSVVPRNRIYARYVGVCADSGLKPLSPASFGKLVRIVFPNLTTRRLGMRGQSKYHYCGLKLINDDGTTSSVGSSANTPLHSHNQTFDSSFLPGTPYGSNSPASFHSQISTPLVSHPTSASTNVSTITSFLNDQSAPTLKFVPELSSLMNDKNSTTDQPLDIPDIKPFLPNDTDQDASDTLFGLYKSHCISIFESIRYVQLKRLFSLISTFHGSLTNPVLKLYTSSDLLQWVISCDSVMYKSLIQMLAKLALQEIPTLVLEQLKVLVAKYVEKLSESLSSLPMKLALVKLKMAKQFIQLVSRFVRVVETAQSANKILSHHMDRQVMYNDWTKHVNVEQIAARELPCEGDNFKFAVEVLQEKIPELLKKESSDYESFIVEWGTYIAALPSSFTSVPPRLFLLCTSALLTSALREISLAGGGGFGAWWVVRCWIDEWVGWCAELGGFVSTQFEESSLLQGTIESHHKFVKPEREDGGPDNVIPAKMTDLASESIDLLDGQFGSILNDEQNDATKK
ncbi:CYFA0S26e00540g1_1 [Cyberlindnera fabianii]|uniref:CYFA0S26e00540g1_1 n=2 Tax=Cyberlindnera fabianii TaxID=36022 RepID=A0A061BA65_CYBFA|nr:CYFA0S26e00540g1_1 [Cyberlindnera fabianii]